MKLDASAARLHGPALVRVWFVSDPQLTALNPLICMDKDRGFGILGCMSQPHTTRFDGWMVRMDLGELVKDGRKIRLQEQPLQILDELLAHAGELVTREQLIARLWPKGVVDFDTGLNSAVRKLRVALQDEAETPRYIETVPRKGYRFIGTIDPPATVQVPTAGETPLPPELAAPTSPIRPSRRTYLYAGAAVALLLVVGLTFVALRRESTPATQTSAVVAAPAASLASRTIAVLPFRAATPGEANETLALVVTDVVRNRLATLNGVVVIATGSMAHLPDAQLDVRETGRKLNAQFLLRGSAAYAGDQISTERLSSSMGRRAHSCGRPRSTIP